MTAGRLINREGEVTANYTYTYDDAGNLVEQTHTSPRGTLIGKFLWEYENGELKKQSFKYIDGSPPMGDGGPAYRNHSNSIEFTCKDGLITGEEINAWASTADGGRFITRVHDYDSEGRRIASTVSARPQFERDGNPFRGMKTKVVFNYDEKGLLKGKVENFEESPDSESEMKVARPISGGNEYVYEFYP